MKTTKIAINSEMFHIDRWHAAKKSTKNAYDVVSGKSKTVD